MNFEFNQRGDGIVYLLTVASEPKPPVLLTLADFEADVDSFSLFQEIDKADDIFQVLLKSGSALHVGRLLLSIRRGMALRAYAARSDVTAAFIQTTPEIAALFYAQALPSILSKGHQS